MKKWTIAFLLGIGTSFACNLSYVRLEFPEDILNNDWEGLDSYQDSTISKMCASYIHSWWFLGFEGVDALPSVLDSNIFKVNPWEDNNIFLFYAFSQSEHTIVDVIKDEFYHYQKCGYIAYSTEKLDSIFLQMEKAIDNQEKDIWYNVSCNCYEAPPAGNYSISSGVLDSIYKLRCESDAIKQIRPRTGNKKIFVTGKKIAIPEPYQRKAYFLIDLQGHLLEQGFLGSLLLRPKQPAILKITGLKAIYIR